MNIRRRIALWICPELLDFRPLTEVSAGKARTPEWASIDHIIKLSDAMGNHLGLTHWAISMRAVGKGNFVDRLKKGGDTHTKTATRVLRYFGENWPADLEWPSDIPRPAPLTEASR